MGMVKENARRPASLWTAKSIADLGSRPAQTRVFCVSARRALILLAV